MFSFQRKRCFGPPTATEIILALNFVLFVRSNRTENTNKVDLFWVSARKTVSKTEGKIAAEGSCKFKIPGPS